MLAGSSLCHGATYFSTKNESVDLGANLQSNLVRTTTIESAYYQFTANTKILGFFMISSNSIDHPVRFFGTDARLQISLSTGEILKVVTPSRAMNLHIYNTVASQARQYVLQSVEIGNSDLDFVLSYIGQRAVSISNSPFKAIHINNTNYDLIAATTNPGYIIQRLDVSNFLSAGFDTLYTSLKAPVAGCKLIQNDLFSLHNCETDRFVAFDLRNSFTPLKLTFDSPVTVTDITFSKDYLYMISIQQIGVSIYTPCVLEVKSFADGVSLQPKCVGVPAFGWGSKVLAIPSLNVAVVVHFAQNFSSLNPMLLTVYSADLTRTQVANLPLFESSQRENARYPFGNLQYSSQNNVKIISSFLRPFPGAQSPDSFAFETYSVTATNSTRCSKFGSPQPICIECNPGFYLWQNPVTNPGPEACLSKSEIPKEFGVQEIPERVVRPCSVTCNDRITVKCIDDYSCPILIRPRSLIIMTSWYSPIRNTIELNVGHRIPPDFLANASVVLLASSTGLEGCIGCLQKSPLQIKRSPSLRTIIVEGVGVEYFRNLDIVVEFSSPYYKLESPPEGFVQEEEGGQHETDEQDTVISYPDLSPKSATLHRLLTPTTPSQITTSVTIASASLQPPYPFSPTLGTLFLLTLLSKLPPLLSLVIPSPSSIPSPSLIRQHLSTSSLTPVRFITLPVVTGLPEAILISLSQSDYSGLFSLNVWDDTQRAVCTLLTQGGSMWFGGYGLRCSLVENYGANLVWLAAGAGVWGFAILARRLGACCENSRDSERRSCSKSWLAIKSAAFIRGFLRTDAVLGFLYAASADILLYSFVSLGYYYKSRMMLMSAIFSFILIFAVIPLQGVVGLSALNPQFGRMYSSNEGESLSSHSKFARWGRAYLRQIFATYPKTEDGRNWILFSRSVHEIVFPLVAAAFRGMPQIVILFIIEIAYFVIACKFNEKKTDTQKLHSIWELWSTLITMAYLFAVFVVTVSSQDEQMKNSRFIMVVLAGCLLVFQVFNIAVNVIGVWRFYAKKSVDEALMMVSLEQQANNPRLLPNLTSASEIELGPLITVKYRNPRFLNNNKLNSNQTKVGPKSAALIRSHPLQRIQKSTIPENHRSRISFLQTTIRDPKHTQKVSD